MILTGSQYSMEQDMAPSVASIVHADVKPDISRVSSYRSTRSTSANGSAKYDDNQRKVGPQLKVESFEQLKVPFEKDSSSGQPIATDSFVQTPAESSGDISYFEHLQGKTKSDESNPVIKTDNLIHKSDSEEKPTSPYSPPLKSGAHQLSTPVSKAHSITDVDMSAHVEHMQHSKTTSSQTEQNSAREFSESSMNDKRNKYEKSKSHSDKPTAEITTSPVHTAGNTADSEGLVNATPKSVEPKEKNALKEGANTSHGKTSDLRPGQTEIPENSAANSHHLGNAIEGSKAATPVNGLTSSSRTSLSGFSGNGSPEHPSVSIRHRPSVSSSDDQWSTRDHRDALRHASSSESMDYAADAKSTDQSARFTPTTRKSNSSKDERSRHTPSESERGRPAHVSIEPKQASPRSSDPILYPIPRNIFMQMFPGVAGFSNIEDRFVDGRPAWLIRPMNEWPQSQENFIRDSLYALYLGFRGEYYDDDSIGSNNSKSIPGLSESLNKNYHGSVVRTGAPSKPYNAQVPTNQPASNFHHSHQRTTPVSPPGAPVAGRNILPQGYSHEEYFEQTTTSYYNDGARFDGPPGVEGYTDAPPPGYATHRQNYRSYNESAGGHSRFERPIPGDYNSNEPISSPASIVGGYSHVRHNSSGMASDHMGGPAGVRTNSIGSIPGPAQQYGPGGYPIMAKGAPIPPHGPNGQRVDAYAYGPGQSSLKRARGSSEHKSSVGSPYSSFGQETYPAPGNPVPIGSSEERIVSNHRTRAAAGINITPATKSASSRSTKQDGTHTGTKQLLRWTTKEDDVIKSLILEHRNAPVLQIVALAKESIRNRTDRAIKDRYYDLRKLTVAAALAAVSEARSQKSSFDESSKRRKF